MGNVFDNVGTYYLVVLTYLVLTVHRVATEKMVMDHRIAVLSLDINIKALASELQSARASLLLWIRSKSGSSSNPITLLIQFTHDIDQLLSKAL
jgi:hypothetical protein